MPTEFAALLDSRPNKDAPWTLNRALDFVGPRGSSNDNTTYQVLAGFNGNLPFGDWTWEAYVSHGNTEVTNTLSGFASRERVRALLAMPNYGKGAVITGNQTLPATASRPRPSPARAACRSSATSWFRRTVSTPSRRTCRT